MIADILKKYWGYDAFRPLQEDIIQSVLQQNDTLALLPTGGGKSICYQVPALAKKGTCIVISPLIALMNDQVAQLQKRGIKAIAITSAMNFKEIEVAFTNALYNTYKFIYISPERIQTLMFLRRLPHLNINLIAVDEAHCISQWGYDFRPAYLQIKKIREIKPDVPILAVTATATQQTADDIVSQLEFKAHQKIYKTSFERKNLHYHIKEDDSKMQTLLNLCKKTGGTGILYVRNRRKTKEISDFLNKNNISSDFYHAGLDAPERDKKQQNWIQNKKRIIVCTNAFGMGIDKPDVRFVAHVDLPDSLEAWFQEVGRGGRDGETSYALTLYNQADILQLQEQLELSFPSPEQITQVYNAICNYYNIAIGAGEGLNLVFNLDEISAKYNLAAPIIFNALKFLEKEDYLSLVDAGYQQSRMYVRAGKEDLYNFQVQNPSMDNFVKTLLRSYTGLFDGFVKINEYKLAKNLQSDVMKVRQNLEKLQRLQILDYIPQSGLPQLIFTQARTDSRFLFLSKESYNALKRKAQQRVQSVIDFVNDDKNCRSRHVLQYFDEETFTNCGHCDVCLRKKHSDKTYVFSEIKKQVQNLVAHQSYPIAELVSLLYRFSKEDVIDCLNQMADDKQIKINPNRIVLKYE